MFRRFTLLAVLLFALPGFARAQDRPTIAVGSKKFTESYVLGEIAKKRLTDAGFSATHRQGLGGTIIVWQALLHGDVAAYPEYTGTITEEILKNKDLQTPDAMRAELQKQGIGMTGELGFNNTYALVMTRKRAAELGVRAMSDLSKHPELRAGPTPEFLGRKDGWQPMASRYAMRFAETKGIEHGLGYSALQSGQIDIKDCYSTDAKIAEYHLLVLDDDLHFFPQYRAVFLYRLDAPPKAVTALQSLAGKIGQDRMTALNARAEATKDYALAASEFFTGDTKAGGASPSRNAQLLAEIPRLTFQHLTLVFWSMLAAVVVGIPLGIAASRGGAAGQAILGVTGVFQTIPSLALLALFIPLFGIGSFTAILALFFYSLLPIVRNTATGLQDIPGPLRESAEALGLDSQAQLRLILLPMASRSILAGIKTSVIINIGTATLAGLIGAGGYGEPIQSGLQLNDKPLILQGAIPAALLALLAQAAFDLLDRRAIPRGLRLREKMR